MARDTAGTTRDMDSIKQKVFRTFSPGLFCTLSLVQADCCWATESVPSLSSDDVWAAVKRNRGSWLGPPVAHECASTCAGLGLLGWQCQARRLHNTKGDSRTTHVIPIQWEQPSPPLATPCRPGPRVHKKSTSHVNPFCALAYETALSCKPLNYDNSPKICRVASVTLSAQLSWGRGSSSSFCFCFRVCVIMTTKVSIAHK